MPEGSVLGNSAIQEIFNHSSPKALSYQQHRAIRDITSCRTAALGGIKISCQNCEYEYYSYRSCRNRNCSQCQSFKQILWTEARSCEVVDTTYYHSVFTVPAELNGIFLNHQKECYNLLFKAVSSTLMTLAADKKYLGAQIGFICILHTWGSVLSFHPHIHVMLMGCGLTRINKLAEKDGFLFPVKVMSRLFRGKMLAGLKKLDFSEDIDYTELYKKEWVVYMKDSVSGPDNVIRYLSRYTHRIAISNERIVSYDSDTVSFNYKDYKDGSKVKVMSLTTDEFTRRFLLHVLPKGFRKVRFYGLLANRNKAEKLEILRRLLKSPKRISKFAGKSAEEKLVLAFGSKYCTCPKCGSGNLTITNIPRPG